MRRLAAAGAGLLLVLGGSAAVSYSALSTRAGNDRVARLSAFATVRVSVPAANAAAPFDESRTLSVPAGWSVEVWARVAGARFAIWTPEHDLLVSVPGAGQVVELHPRTSTGSAAVPRQSVLVSGLTEPQGMAFDVLGGQRVLYVAESDELDRYVWRSDGSVGARTVVVPDLPDLDPTGDDVHRMKEVVVGPDHTIYIDVGSSSNVDTTDLTASPPRAVVMAFQPDGAGRVYATGIRNGDGLSFDPDGDLWAAVNNRDQIAYPFHLAYGGLADAFGHVLTAYVNDHPPDELVRLAPGRNVGWPYCNPDPDPVPGNASGPLRYGDLPFDPDAQTNPEGGVLDCSSLAPLDRGIPAHSAPLGFHFLQGSGLPGRWSNGAVLAAHASWDRTPPRPPAVLWFPWDGTAKTLGAEVVLVTGFQDAGGARWGRPVDAAPGPDHALYVTDDTAGAAYRIVPAGLP